MKMIEKIKKRLATDIVFRNVVIALSSILIAVYISAMCLSVFTRHGQQHKVPDFSGMTLEEAERTAKELELRLEVIDSLYVPVAPKGTILEQYPKPENVVKSKRRIFLTINTFKPKMVPMPYVTGFSLRQAKNKLIGSGFVIDKLEYRDDIATNNILEQRYNGKIVSADSDILAEVATGVTLIVGLNPVDHDPVVPGVVGLSVDQAKSRLWEAGFNIGAIDLDKDVNYENINDAKVYFQSLPKSSRAMYGRSVSLSATLDRNLIEKGFKESEAESQQVLKLQQQQADSLPEEAPIDENKPLEELLGGE